MNTTSNPQSLRTRRTPRLAFAAAALLLALALLSLAAPQRPAGALLPGTRSLAPTVTVNNSSVVVNEGQTAINAGSFDDTVDTDSDTVRVSASVGTVTQSGTRNGTWNWSYATPNVSDDQPTQVKITAKDSTGRYTSKYFSLKVLDLDPYPTNDMFANASPIDLAASLYGERYGNTRLATREAGEPDHRYSSSGQDCGIYGRQNTVWFKVTTPPSWPSEGSAMTFRTTFGGTNFDTVLALYRGTSLGTLQQVACSNNNPHSSSGDWSDALVISPPGTLSTGSTYYLQLSGTGGAPSGKYRLAYEHCPYPVGSEGVCIG